MRRLKQQRTYEVALSKAGLGPVAGVDEAGRGACCGPITIAACILPDRIIPELDKLTDSKKLSPATREKLFPIIKDKAVAWSVVHIDARDIDKRGIQHANVSGMRRAVARLDVRPHYVLSDALKVPGMPAPQLPIIGGDAAARCIAAASVLAKVSRDHIMDELDVAYPGYGLAGHKGYGTAAHQAAIAELGATSEHRMSYANVASAHAEFLARA
ncbi:ribonuclease HII [Corynebacterium striatum]|uniref:ribonuclease HII n=1 Tax=Corynebacterium striatum TaxID=43770 RepID=UPI001661AD0B|nr:ribonuclease HII [Corynebacterium striatum]MBD0854245.1 ribonuclease HII [Corynebacterium striatum]MDK8842627.1 ribonuclease HII [Corynebacterium striatum]